MVQANNASIVMPASLRKMDAIIMDGATLPLADVDSIAKYMSVSVFPCLGLGGSLHVIVPPVRGELVCC